VTETTADLTTIEQTVDIDAPPELVWDYWTDPKLLTEWWGIEADVQAAPGGSYRIVMEGGPVARGEYTEVDRPKRLVFTFGWEGNTPSGPLAPGSTRVEVTLTPHGEGTRLVLRHELPSTHAADHSKGWAFFVGERLPAAIKAR
jgi:uncharacterized protein YndB with AHSA1/START domain